MTGERAQGLVEAVVAMPVCIACALVIADAGVVVRDRIAVAQAATRAAEARVVGKDEEAAAERALPAALRRTVDVDVDGESVQVVARSRSRIAAIVGHPIVHRSSVEVAR